MPNSLIVNGEKYCFPVVPILITQNCIFTIVFLFRSYKAHKPLFFSMDIRVTGAIIMTLGGRASAVSVPGGDEVTQ